ncbi:uncharacterized protein At4g06598 [Rhodamnia argentea]|uniref:Uncharacterized protein At4g06598 n=1 Tax=Rhodamnia argentea TaxID=178133 RepID=A0A8B8PXA3_9MYRT|nr:uncharacterized protein At4g06598 [Rhodamnia argentea]XP_030539422.1 uncharacterized protein At4g06598 [Rhodamnia argentea]
MANSKGTANIRNFMYSGRHALLPPKSPFPSVSSSFADYMPSAANGPKAVQKPRDSYVHHQRTSSESLVIEEQPSWLDDLLNEPETPVRRAGHRRSSSDSFAYVDVANFSLDYAAHDEYALKNTVSVPSWGAQDFDHYRDGRHSSFHPEASSVKQSSRVWESSLNKVAPPSGVTSGPSYSLQEIDRAPSGASEKQYQVESSSNDSKSSERRDSSHIKPSASETDTKRAKQQFAQRSRVRKLQYIAELERNVQALQAEGSDVSAELEFLNQQNLILSMENKALKQRLESLAQEQMIKYLEHEVLEREIGRLRALYQQQQQPLQQQQQQHKQPSSSLRRTTSKDLDTQFANLALKHKDANSGQDTVSGPLHT